MRLGILVSFLGDYGQKGFYNVQEYGLACAMDHLCEDLIIYRLVKADQIYREEQVAGCKNSVVHFLPSKGLGNNGIVDTKVLDKSLDALLYFSDTQLSLPAVARWAKHNGVLLIPYIGVVQSHSTSKLKRIVMDLLFFRNLAVYKKLHCAVKTPAVQKDLEKLGVGAVTVTPVGLDLSLLKQDYMDTDISGLKQKYGYAPKDKVLLFIGRMTEEKQPLRMIDLFDRLHRRDSGYKLLMVGTGELRSAVDNAIADRGLSDAVQMIDRIPNKDIWELYRIADSFVNLNRQEIFGMAILEAMYYGCKVVAWEAPGPSFIIENGVSGCLADSDEGILKAIAEDTILPEAAHRRILDHFTWDRTAEKLLSIAESR